MNHYSNCKYHLYELGDKYTFRISTINYQNIPHWGFPSSNSLFAHLNDLMIRHQITITTTTEANELLNEDLCKESEIFDTIKEMMET